MLFRDAAMLVYALSSERQRQLTSKDSGLSGHVSWNRAA